MLNRIIKDYCYRYIKLNVFPQVLQGLIHNYKVYQSDYKSSNELLTKTVKSVENATFSRCC
jgi:hypothetical protein